MVYDGSPLPQPAYVYVKETDGGVPAVIDDDCRLVTSDGSPAEQPTKETTDGGVPAATDDGRRLATSVGSPLHGLANATDGGVPAVREVDGSVDPLLLCWMVCVGSPLPSPAYATAYDDECRQMTSDVSPTQLPANL